MTETALAIYVVWLLVALVFRGILQLARTGDHGFRLHTERPWSGAWFARMGFILSLVLGGAAPVLAVAEVVEPIAEVRSIQIVGLVLAVVGIVATFIAQLAMGASWRVGVDGEERTELVTRWPFTWVRNPIFTTMGLTALGLTLMVPSAVALVGLALLAWSLEYQVRHVEEPYLRTMHGRAYEHYLSTVGRFLPRTGLERP